MTALLPLMPLCLDVFAKATALLALAALADAGLARRGPAAARHFVWALAMTALVALPVAIATLPHWQIRIPIEPASVSGAPTTAAGAAAALSDLAPVSSALDITPDAPRPSSLPLAAIALVGLAAIYVGGVVLLLARLAFEPIAIGRLTRDADVVDDAEWRALLDRSVGAMGVRRPVRLLRSRGDVMPLTFGTLAPTIVLPASAGAWTDDRRRAVLLHELAHVVRRDCLAQRVTAVACALYWPHPGVWFGARRLRAERELACDDRVLAAGAGARDYAGHLLELARSFGRAPAPRTALGMARPRQLERRLLAILDAARNRTALRGRGLAAIVVIAGSVFVSMAGLRAAIVPADAAEPIASIGTSEATAAAQDGAGTWDLHRTQDPAVVQISIRTDHGNHGRTIRLERLARLSSLDQITAQIDAPSAQVHVPIRRDAGTFTVDGVCRRGVCGGTFTFQADPAFADALVKRGIGRPSPPEQMALAVADAGFAYLDALAAAGYAKPDVQTLVRGAQHGVDADYLRGMTALGYKTATLDELIQLRDHGVDPSYIRGMQQAGYARLSADELRHARDHGADPVYSREMAALGFAHLPLSDLIAARDHGVDQVYVRDMQALGHRLTLDEYRRTRDHGVDPQYIRGLAELGYGGLSVDALVGARDHGVDPAYVRGMADVGYKGVPLHDLIRMRDHGVDPDYVRRVQRTGAHPNVDEIIRMRDHGEPNPDAAVRAVVSRVQYYLGRINRWLRS